MTKFTINELTMLHECIMAQLPATKGIGKEFVLEMLADKCIRAKIDLKEKMDADWSKMRKKLHADDEEHTSNMMVSEFSLSAILQDQ